MRFSRQEPWSGLPFPSPGDCPDPGVEPRSFALQADSLSSEPTGKPGAGTYPVYLKDRKKASAARQSRQVVLGGEGREMGDQVEEDL